MSPETSYHVLLIVGGIVGAWLLIGISGALPLIAIWKASPQPVSEEKARIYLQQVLSSGQVTGTWAIADGFEPVDVLIIKTFLMHAVIVGWKHVHDDTYLCAYIILGGRIELDFVSSFGNGSHLTTGTMRDGQILPTGPKNWMQSFSVSNASELWIRHQAALEHLKITENLQPTQNGESLAVEFQAAIQLQSKYIRSIPFWLLRIPYWYFTRQLARHNKPLAELT